MKTTRAAMCLAAATGAAALFLGGCSSSDKAAEVRADPTPELISLSERPVDRKNRWAYTRNTYYRSLTNDVSRFILMDRPSRMIYSVTPF